VEETSTKKCWIQLCFRSSSHQFQFQVAKETTTISLSLPIPQSICVDFKKDSVWIWFTISFLVLLPIVDRTEKQLNVHWRRWVHQENANSIHLSFLQLRKLVFWIDHFASVFREFANSQIARSPTSNFLLSLPNQSSGWLLHSLEDCHAPSEWLGYVALKSSANTKRTEPHLCHIELKVLLMLILWNSLLLITLSRTKIFRLCSFYHRCSNTRHGKHERNCLYKVSRTTSNFHILFQQEKPASMFCFRKFAEFKFNFLWLLMFG
jgi:hypothetical protein